MSVYGQNFVGWRDYEGVDGFGVATADDLRLLKKALAAGSDVNAPAVAPGVGFPLRVESLERTLKNTTFRMEHIKLWKAMPKRPGFNTVEEFNQIQSYGNLDAGAFMPEGGLPNEIDSTYERKTFKIKFMGAVGRVNQVMTLLKPAHGNVIAMETVTKTMELLRQIERNLFTARSDLDELQWDGIEKQIEDGVLGTSGNVIDLRGEPLTEDRLVDAALTIQDAPNFGMPTHLYMAPKVKADLVKTFFPKARYDLLGKTDQGLVGLDIKGFTSPAGDITFESDVFIDDGGGVSGLVALGDVSLRPASPTISTAVTTPADAASQFVSSDEGNYFWWVVAVNSNGQSAPVQVNAVAAAVLAGDKATFGVTPGAGPTVKYYKIYRTKVGGAASTARLILRVANAAGAGEQVINDFNARLPGTTSAYMLQLNQENMSFVQLLPMVKIPLATVDTSIRWMQLIYGAPVIYTPRHNVVFRNVGRAPDFVGAP